MRLAHVLHYVGATVKSRSVVASLVADLVEEGYMVKVLDITGGNTIHQDLPPPWIARLLGHRVLKKAFEQQISNLGAVLQTLEGGPRFRAPDAVHSAALNQSLESELLTYFRSDSIPRTREARSLEHKLKNSMERTYQVLEEFWSQESPDLVLIPNGRTSRQKAARLVAESRSFEIELYEYGRAKPNSYYRGNTQPHDRLASQAEVAGLMAALGPNEIRNLASSWLADRVSASSETNQFSASWKPAGASPAPTKTQKKAIFFSSSFDEFLAYGPMWRIGEWENQFEAFDLMMRVLEERGYQIAIRLHPNLGLKSRQYFLREISDVLTLKSRHPELTIHWHNSVVNSYDLVTEADIVVVERSTIGLEASLMGKPVWTTQASQWDLVADVRQILNPSDVTAESMAPWRASPMGAQRFVAYWMIQEHPLHFDWSSWSSWNPDKPPLRMKLAQLAVKNPWSHRLRLITLELAKWQNRNFKPPRDSAQNK